jgi:enoyl-CoA hydratase/carnithine racemase
MKFQEILINIDSYIATITLNRPEHYNTFSITMASELNQSLKSFESDPTVRVVIIKGAGRYFCAGIDVNDLKDKTQLEYLRWVELMEMMSITISEMGKPVIASVHKIAVANGIGLVASCDLAVAAEDAKFGATAINVGLFCMGPAVPLSRSLGRKKALELLMTGDLIDAKEAERIGLVNKVVPRDQLEVATLKLAEKLAKKSPLALQLGKQSFYKMEDLAYQQAMDLTNNHFATLCTTEDAHEGVSAFLKKRKPNWQLK